MGLSGGPLQQCLSVGAVGSDGTGDTRGFHVVDAIDHGADWKGLGLGTAVLAGGVMLVVMGALSGYTLTIGRVTLPGWSIYVVGGIAVVVGGLLVAGSLRTSRCAACKRPLQHAEACYPPETESSVIDAIKRLDTATLTQTPSAAPTGSRVVLALDFCDGCRQVAELRVARSTDTGDEELIPPCVLTGPHIDALAEVAEAQEAERNGL